MLEVQRPHVIGAHGLDPLTALLTDPPPLACLGGAFEAFLAPQPPGAFLVHRQAFSARDRVGFAPPPPGVLLGDRPQPCPQLLLAIGANRGLEALGGAVLPHEAAGTALGDPEHGDEQIDCAPTAFGA